MSHREYIAVSEISSRVSTCVSELLQRSTTKRTVTVAVMTMVLFVQEDHASGVSLSCRYSFVLPKSGPALHLAERV